MTIDRDRTLQSLFDLASKDVSEDLFTAQVMSRIDRSRRRALIGWSTIGLLLVACAWLIATPLLNALPLITELAPATLIELDNSRPAQVLAPLNSVAGVAALSVIVLRTIYRKLVS